MDDEEDDEILREIPVEGFDPEGEPSILEMADGTLQVTVAFMPPSTAEDKEEYFVANFDKQMAKAIGVEVEWRDRELFVIAEPREDTVAQMTAFLQSYWTQHPEALR